MTKFSRRGLFGLGAGAAAVAVGVKVEAAPYPGPAPSQGALGEGLVHDFHYDAAAMRINAHGVVLSDGVPVGVVSSHSAPVFLVTREGRLLWRDDA